MCCNTSYTSDDFSLTFTLSPQMYDLPVKEQVSKTFSLIIKLINCLCPEDYEYVIEQTKRDNIHYHFYLLFKEDLKLGKLSRKLATFIKELDIENMLGFYKLKTCYDRENWLKYMFKNPYIPDADILNITQTKPFEEYDNDDVGDLA